MGYCYGHDMVGSVPFVSLSEGHGGEEKLWAGAWAGESPPAHVEEP